MSDRKNEYHNLVSPIVRSGGRCMLTHIPAMKMRKIIEPMSEVAIVPFLWLRKANIVPPTQQAAAAVAYM